ncbi:hypothetical protein P280DRAFT_115522 [Massarina eburnea CBS 473.64]|uniref:Uncharacterized protein n=1 Tax=Massarina eburnea CBS 473.64 TaxID=1395130 RepID=A0A6A6SCE5_9PLEO|nr:hypothetical protein P280DRAFT_115522 [Massarina eburnea CBS 473.64]
MPGLSLHSLLQASGKTKVAFSPSPAAPSSRVLHLPRLANVLYALPSLEATPAPEEGPSLRPSLPRLPHTSTTSPTHGFTIIIASQTKAIPCMLFTARDAAVSL